MRGMPCKLSDDLGQIASLTKGAFPVYLSVNELNKL